MWVPTRALTLLPVAAAAIALAGTGCGGERTFTAEEFVDEMEANGVTMELGSPLFTDQEGKEVYEVELEPLPGAPTPAEGALRAPQGSLSVHDEVSGADDQLGNCKATADLLCFRAANIVIVLQGGGIEADRLGVAMRKLEN